MGDFQEITYHQQMRDMIESDVPAYNSAGKGSIEISAAVSKPGDGCICNEYIREHTKEYI
jgi:hypothetical protein